MTIVDRRYSVAEGQAVKAPCRAATTANITLSGQQTIDGIAVVADDRVLVKNQSTGSQNGIYTVSTGSWSRARDFDGASDVVSGSRVYITSGTVSGGIEYTVSTTGTITIGTTSIAFTSIGATTIAAAAAAAASATAASGSATSAASSASAASTSATSASASATAAAASASSFSGSLKDTVTAAEALTPTTNINAVLIAGNDSVGDAPFSGWAKVAGAPSHTAKFQSAGGHWYLNTDAIIDVRSIATIDLTGAVNCASELQAAITTAATLYRPLYLPKGIYLLGTTRIRVPSNSRIIGAGWRNTQLKRTVDDTDGTVEVYNASNVLIQGVGITTTLSTYTLGYGQTGFCARNGSTDVWFVECGVSGTLNRKFHCMNSARVRFLRCEAPFGSGNAALRIVSDFAASGYSEVSDENAPITVRDIWVDGCQFFGCSTEGGTDRVMTYGIAAASVTSATDLCSVIKITNNSVAYNLDQGISAGGNVKHVTISGNSVRNVFVSTAGLGGTGILVVKSTDSPFFTRVVNNSVELCDQGIYSTEAIKTVIANNQSVLNMSNGILVSAGTDNLVNGNITDENGGAGIYALTSTADIVITSNISRANSTYGIRTDAGVTGIEIGNSCKGNTTANYLNNGTMIFGNTGSPVGNT